jgi:hypothetical protein
LTPRVVNSVRVGITSYDVTFNRPQRAGGSVLTGLLFTSPISAAFSTGRSVPSSDISDTLTWVRGKHTMKAGFRVQPSTDSEWTDNGRGSNVSLNPALTTAIGPNAASVISIADRTTFIQLYDNLLGRISSTQQTFYSNDLINYLPADSSKFRKRRYHDAAVFFQDDWRVNRRLTINYGLRWEYMGLPQLDGAFEHLDQESLVNGVTPVDNFHLLPGAGAAKSYKRGFAPRLGLAWDPFGDGKTAIRAAWGIYYDRIQSGDFSSSDGNPGVSAISADFRNLQSGSDDRLADGIPAVPPPASVNLALPVNHTGFFFTYSPHLRLPYEQQMNFTVQREIARRTALDVAYVGGRGVQLQSLADYAEPHLSADFLQAFREIQTYQASGVQPSAANLFVRLFGTPAAALSAMNGTFVRAGAAGRVAANLSLSNVSFASAALPDWYLAPYPQFSHLYVVGNDGRSYYNSLQISLRRSIGSLRMNANYTWSKNIDNLPLADIGSPFSYQDLRDVRGLADSNVPQDFTTTATYSLPFGRGKGFAAHLPRPVATILANWDVGIINQMQAGYAFSATSGYMTSDSFSTAGNRADLSTAGTLGQIVRSGNGVSYFTPQQVALFSIPTPGNHGTAARNMFRGPMYWNTNASLVRRFQVTERAWLHLRAEAFNLLNRTNFLGVDGNLASPTFGRISSTFSPRVLQFALRLDF